MSQGRHWKVIFLTCREPKTDFRLPLAEEIHRLGHDVTYIHLRRKPYMIRIPEIQERTDFSLIQFLLYMVKSSRSRDKVLIFNTTNLAFPSLSTILRLIVRGKWCFDMHDDLLYGSRGLSRIKKQIAQRLLVAMSHIIVHAAPTLHELFPSSIHLGNASSMQRVERCGESFQRVLVLASIDERFDFSFLKAAARHAKTTKFDIYGQISRGESSILAQLQQLTRDCPNITYNGPYVNDDLPQILERYAVTVAPYVTNSQITRYIDPLRYYHCLNSGMEVISTSIPKAQDFDGSIHIVDEPEEISQIIDGLTTGRIERRSGNSRPWTNTWKHRAGSLMSIVEDHESISK